MPNLVQQSRDAGTDRQYIPKGWTAKIVDGETVFQSPTGGIETTDIERVHELVRDGGPQ